MTMPSGPDPKGWDLKNVYGAVVGAGVSALAGRKEAPIRKMLENQVQSSSTLTGYSDKVFAGLDATLGLPVGVVKALSTAFGINVSGLTGINQFLTQIQNLFVTLPKMVAGFIQAINVPGLDASKIISGTISEPVTGLNTLRDAITNGLGLVGSGLTNIQAQNQATAVNQTASAASASAASANAFIAAQQAAANANQRAGGAYFNMTPSGADGAALAAADFGSTGPTAGDLCIRGANGYMGIKTANADGVGYYTICAAARQFTTDDQSLAVVLGDQGGLAAAPLYLYTHTNNTHTAGAYCRIDNASLTMGSYTRSGSVYTYTPFAGGSSTGLSIQGGNRVEFRNIGTTYYVLLNNIQQGTPVTNASVTFGAANRYSAISMDRKTASNGWFFGSTQYDAFRVTAVSIADYVTPTYVGSGAKMFRASITQIIPTYTLDTQALLPTNYFDSTDKATADITVDRVNGRFTVANAGWYAVTFRTAITPGTMTNQFAVSPVLYKSIGGVATAVEWGCPHQAGLADTANANRFPFYGLSSDFEIYLAANDFVQMGYVHTGMGGNTWKMQGAAGGLQTYMNITLLNRSTL